MARVTVDNWSDETVWDDVHTVNDGAFKIEEDVDGCHVTVTATGEKLTYGALGRNGTYTFQGALTAISGYIDRNAAVREP